MGNGIEVFKNEQFGEIRTIVDKENDYGKIFMQSVRYYSAYMS